MPSQVEKLQQVFEKYNEMIKQSQEEYDFKMISQDESEDNMEVVSQDENENSEVSVYIKEEEALDNISVCCIVCGAETDSNGLCVVRKSLEIENCPEEEFSLKFKKKPCSRRNSHRIIPFQISTRRKKSKLIFRKSYYYEMSDKFFHTEVKILMSEK